MDHTKHEKEAVKLRERSISLTNPSRCKPTAQNQTQTPPIKTPHIRNDTHIPAYIRSRQNSCDQTKHAHDFLFEIMQIASRQYRERQTKHHPTADDTGAKREFPNAGQELALPSSIIVHLQAKPINDHELQCRFLERLSFSSDPRSD